MRVKEIERGNAKGIKGVSIQVCVRVEYNVFKIMHIHLRYNAKDIGCIFTCQNWTYSKLIKYKTNKVKWWYLLHLGSEIYTIWLQHIMPLLSF